MEGEFEQYAFLKFIVSKKKMGLIIFVALIALRTTTLT